MLRTARCAQARRLEVNTVDAALDRLGSILTKIPEPCTPTNTRTQVIHNTLAVLAQAGEEVCGGVLRDLLGCFDEDVQDIDIKVPELEEENFVSRRAKIIELLLDMGVRLVGQEWKGADKCLELYFTWRTVDTVPVSLKINDLDVEDKNLLCIQLSRKNAFSNKSADFDVCQFSAS
jgi:hypothetical protein